MHAATSKVENSAQGSSCKLKFVHGYFLPVSLSFIDDAVPTLSTGVGQLFPDGAFEETLATFAAVDTVMFAWKSNTSLRQTNTHIYCT
jgi:hypothetical protein